MPRGLITPQYNRNGIPLRDILHLNLPNGRHSVPDYRSWSWIIIYAIIIHKLISKILISMPREFESIILSYESKLHKIGLMGPSNLLRHREFFRLIETREYKGPFWVHTHCVQWQSSLIWKLIPSFRHKKTKGTTTKVPRHFVFLQDTV